jgi:hypothetical protein
MTFRSWQGSSSVPERQAADSGRCPRSNSADASPISGKIPLIGRSNSADPSVAELPSDFLYFNNLRRWFEAGGRAFSSESEKFR